MPHVWCHIVNGAWFQLHRNIPRPEVAMTDTLSVQEAHPLGDLIRVLVGKMIVRSYYIRSPVDEAGSEHWYHYIVGTDACR